MTGCHRATHLDQITSMRLMRGACATEGTTGAVRHHTTTVRGCGREGGGGDDGMSPSYPPSTSSLAFA